MLELSNVTYRHHDAMPKLTNPFYQRVGPGIKGISIQLAPKKILGLVGPNGTGKTTLMKVMAGLLPPEDGHLLIDGNPVTDEKSMARLRHAVSFMPEQVGWPGPGTPRRVMSRLCAMRGEDNTNGLLMLDLVGLTQRANDDLSTLSQGMRQRLSLATALLGGPEVLLLDEPLNGLDPVAQAAFRGLLRQLASNGASIVVSSHNLNELARFVDEVCILHMGRIVSIGTITEVERFLGIAARLEVAGLGTNPSVALTAAIEGVSVSELKEEEGSDWHLEISLHEEEWDTGRRAEVATVISESGAKLSHLSVVKSDLEHILEAATGLSAEEAGFAILSTEEATKDE